MGIADCEGVGPFLAASGCAARTAVMDCRVVGAGTVDPAVSEATMLLTIATTHRPATDLGFLLYKHPDRVQTFALSFGNAHVFYPEATPERTTACLLLDVDPVGLVRRRGGRQGFLLAQEVFISCHHLEILSPRAASVQITCVAAGVSRAKWRENPAPRMRGKWSDQERQAPQEQPEGLFPNSNIGSPRGSTQRTVRSYAIH